jgi:DNA-directed RNA polymerase sigma subunit (sigma70/sigma32)
MMTRKKTKKTTEVRTRTLTPLEEKIVRMRRGLTAPDDLVLEQVGQDDAEVAAQLREIEERALEAVGARKSPAKRRIVKALRSKDS